MNGSGTIEELERAIGCPLPSPDRRFLASHTENVRDDGLTLYPAESVEERNTSYHVQRFTQEFLAVGDDGGGRLVIIRLADQDVQPLLVDAGAVLPNLPPSLLKPLSRTWDFWLADACPLPLG